MAQEACAHLSKTVSSQLCVLTVTACWHPAHLPGANSQPPPGPHTHSNRSSLHLSAGTISLLNLLQSTIQLQPPCDTCTQSLMCSARVLSAGCQDCIAHSACARQLTAAATAAATHSSNHHVTTCTDMSSRAQRACGAQHRLSGLHCTQCIRTLFTALQPRSPDRDCPADCPTHHRWPPADSSTQCTTHTACRSVSRNSKHS